jgi:hypothetical protein
MICGGRCFVSHQGSITGVKPVFRWVKTCIKATVMDRFIPNLPFSFGKTLWRLRKVIYFFINRGVKTKWSKPVSGPIQRNLSGSFKISLGMLCGGPLFLHPRDAIMCAYKGMICRRMRV